MENKTFNLIFDRVCAKLPFSYGVLIGAEMNDTNKSKMKKRNLKKRIKNIRMGFVQADGF